MSSVPEVLPPTPAAAGTRARLLDVAEALLDHAGPAHVDRVTTRALCQAAGVTAPTLYHHFGDKKGLLAALVTRTSKAFIAAKATSVPTENPVEDLRRGWDAWVDFALAHPALFVLAMGDPRAAPDAMAVAHGRLRDLLARVERAGRLALPLPLAIETVWAASQGVTALLARRAYGDAALDDLPAVSAALREAVVAVVTA